MEIIKVFLGGYINSTNAQNLNCNALAKHLDKNKFEIYTLEIYSGKLKNRSMEGVNIFHCFYPHRISVYLGYLWGIWNADVVYLPRHEVNGWNQFWLKLLRKKSFSTIEGIMDDYVMSVLTNNYGSKEKVVAHYNQSFDKVFSITKFMHRYNLEHHGVNSKEKPLYLGTDIAVFLNESKTVFGLHQIIMIGSDLLRKGVYDFLELASIYPDVTFHLVGSGIGRIDMPKELKSRGLPNVVYHKEMTHDELVELLNEMDLHILPSHSEGFPKVTLEAAAAGVPSLVYADYGADEWIIDHKNGFVVNSLDEMKDVIQELLETPILLQNASKNAIVMANMFDWTTLVKEWEKEIERLVEEK